MWPRSAIHPGWLLQVQLAKYSVGAGAVGDMPMARWPWMQIPPVQAEPRREGASASRRLLRLSAEVQLFKSYRPVAVPRIANAVRACQANRRAAAVSMKPGATEFTCD